ncbi:MAG: alpha/beta hydrolase [Chromatiales bacterium]|nr:alpha/beta hydrolase [Chromatiales bacterium]MDX9766471.1 alpha/beta hydrolase [Ectothiorhodospiraceae bacterium]
MREGVVLVHGIWMSGLEMLPLARRLRRQGFETRLFRYPSVRATPAANAARLDAFLERLDWEVVHLVAHSLGGIVLLHLFDRYPVQRPGRVVMLGTPITGSRTARAYAATPLRPLLGRSLQRGLLGDVPRWKGGRELGMIAGSRGFGVGSMPGIGLHPPHDGTVALDETRSFEIDSHLTVPFGHFSMLWSADVAAAVAGFLKSGDFSGLNS